MTYRFFDAASADKSIGDMITPGRQTLPAERQSAATRHTRAAAVLVNRLMTVRALLHFDVNNAILLLTSLCSTHHVRCG